MIKAGKIYIVEDDAAVLTPLKEHLSQNYQVLTVSNFRDIKQEVIDYKPDLILMDITLPFLTAFTGPQKFVKHQQCQLFLSQAVMMRWIRSWHLIWEEMISSLSPFL